MAHSSSPAIPARHWRHAESDPREFPTTWAAPPVLLFACLLSACTSAPRQANQIIERHVRFVCDNKEGVEMQFFPQQGIAVLVRHGRTIELQQQRAASGFVYSNGPNTVRGKGDEITLEIGRMVPLGCKAIKQGAAGNIPENADLAAVGRS